MCQCLAGQVPNVWQGGLRGGSGTLCVAGRGRGATECVAGVVCVCGKVRLGRVTGARAGRR